LAGDKETGVTLMRMDKGLDTGNMLAKVSCPIEPDDTSSTLHDKLAQLGADLLVDKLDTIVTLPGDVQDNQQTTHAGKIHKEDAHIDWNKSAIDIERQIRSFNPWPVAFCQAKEEVVRIWQANVVPLKTVAAPGTIVEHTAQGIVVATQNQGLLLINAQLPGKKAMPFSEILKGHATLFAINQVLT
jgi:methionyl-tRNA formyltransferase